MSKLIPDGWIRTHCARFDHGGCGLKVLVENGRIKDVRADEENPYSRGYCCAKGLASADRNYHPGRLTRPLLRKGERGSGNWEEISWDRALDTLSSEFRKSIDKLGPESVAFAQGAPKGLEFFTLTRLANLLKCPTIGASQHVCHMPREQMAVATCGFFPVPDYERPTGCVLLWGGDPERTNEEGVLGKFFLDALKNGGRLIAVDPLKTAPAGKADVWLQIVPGTDDLLAAGLIHIIIEENLFDAEFVEQWTVGFQELRESVRRFVPATVSAGTGVPAELLVKAARLYATTKPAMIHWGNAVEHTCNSSQTCRMLVILMALTGNLEAPGGNIKTELPELMRPADLICLKQFPGRMDKLINRTYGLTPRLITTPNWMVYRSILDQSPYPIKCLYLQGTNPVISGANPEEIRSALLKLDFLAVADVFMTPSAALADLVLPSATNFEFNDIGHYGLPHGHVFARPKAIDPPGEAWPDIRIFNEWGKRLGFGDFFWNDEFELVEAVLKPSGLNYGQFAEKGMLHGPRLDYSYRDKGFSTPSGKVELKSSLLEKWGASPLPAVVSPPAPGDDYPLILTSRKPRYFFHSAYRMIERLRKKSEVPKALIHPETAAKAGIGAGEKVEISTASGQIAQTAELSDKIGKNVVCADFGWWFPERADEDFGWRDSNINMLVSTSGPIDPMLGTVQLRGIPCNIRKAG